jgi:predicted Zn finger-like uncharacterized protein
MDIICDKCQSKFKIPDNKIPAGKIVTLPCPKCKNKISIGSSKKIDDSKPNEKKAITAFNEIDSDVYDASEKPFDFVEEEGKTALICESDLSIKKKIADVLHIMEYHFTEAESARDALKQMRYHDYDMIIVNEDFDTKNPDSNGVLIYLERLSMDIRRNIFVTMISSRFHTMDNMMTFNKSVNLIINIKNIDDIDKVLQRGIADNELFYRVFRDSLKETGRI